MKFVVGLMLVTAVMLACGGSEQTVGPATPTVTLQLGDTIPLDTTVRINQGGAYPLPMGAVSLRTRCFGSVELSFTPASGVPQNDTCSSLDGSANQTNNVTGASDVTYSFSAGGFAHVTLM